MFEVERKYKVHRRDFATIQDRLFKRLLPAVPLLQEDTYLQDGDPTLTVRVRCQRSRDTVCYLLTKKRKCSVAANTNEESESEITAQQYESLLRSNRAVYLAVPLAVRKRRIEFYCQDRGHEVTICLDTVRGSDDIRLGYMVELETMVSEVGKIKAAHAALGALADEVLPRSRTRERRGYRSMLRDALDARARRRK